MPAQGDWERQAAGFLADLMPGAVPDGVSADIAELILAVHTRVGSLFTALDRSAVSERSAQAPSALIPVWAAAAELLLLNAEAEEEICFPAIFGHGPEGLAATGRAIADHDDIREAICEARLQDAGSGAWWRAVNATRKASSNHFTGPESSALILFGRCGPADLRQTLGRWWINFVAARLRDRETGRTPQKPRGQEP
jgi:Hemerythrin HHE cation binding domain